MRLYAFRVKNGLDLKHEIVKFSRANNVKAGFILTCTGGLTRATLRMAGATPKKETIRDYEEPLEIVSLVGTISKDGVHLHVSLSDRSGKVVGGHMKDKCLVYPTAEVVIGELEGYSFERQFDKNTGYNELVVNKA